MGNAVEGLALLLSGVLDARPWMLEYDFENKIERGNKTSLRERDGTKR